MFCPIINWFTLPLPTKSMHNTFIKQDCYSRCWHQVLPNLKSFLSFVFCLIFGASEPATSIQSGPSSLTIPLAAQRCSPQCRLDGLAYKSGWRYLLFHFFLQYTTYLSIPALVRCQTGEARCSLLGFAKEENIFIIRLIGIRKVTRNASLGYFFLTVEILKFLSGKKKKLFILVNILAKH